MKRLGVLGWPVAHSRSPAIQRAALAALGMDGYSYQRLPRGRLPQSYGPEMPELIVEVRSKSDRWPGVLAKVAEYLDAGVSAVVVLDDGQSTAHIFPADRNQILRPDEELTLAGILPGFSIAVRRFFE